MTQSSHFVGTLETDQIQADGMPGLTKPSRFVGGTDSGPPTDNGDGTFVPGDWVKDDNGLIFTCVALGVWKGQGPLPPPPPPPVNVPPSCTSNPVITGTPSVGSTLTCSGDTWSGTQPLMFTYQWKLNGISILGAIGATYVVQAADVSGTLTVEETATNIAGHLAVTSKGIVIPGGGGGSLSFKGSFSSKATYLAAGERAGFVDKTNMQDQNYHYRGLINWLPDFNGQPAVSITISQPPSYAPTGGPGGWWGAAQLTHYPPWGVGTEWWIGQSLWVPAGGLVISLASAPNVGELYDGVGGQPTWEWMLTKNNPSVKITPLLGAYNGSAFQWNSQNLPALYAVPPGGLVNGTWNSWIMRIKAEVDNSGEMDSWYRSAGGAWVQSSSLRGYPTMKWQAGQNPVAGPIWNAPSCYAKQMPNPTDPDTTLYFGKGIFEGSSFSAVAAMLP